MGDDGMLFDFSVRFNTYVDTDMLAASLEDLEAGEITIVNEVYPYTYSNFGDSNDYINIFSITYNVEINEPTLTVIDESVPGFNQGSNYKAYKVTYDPLESAALAEKFGYSTIGDEAIVANSYATLAQEVHDQLVNTVKKIYNRTAAIPLLPDSFSTIRPITAITGSNLEREQAGIESTAGSGASAMTSTTMGGGSTGGGGY